MTFQELRKKSYVFGSAIALDRFIGRHTRKEIKKLCLILLPIIVVTLVLSNRGLLPVWISGFLYLDILIYFFFFSLDAFYASYYFKDLSLVVKESGFQESDISFEVAQALFETYDSNITRGFLDSQFGKQIFFRCGLSQSEINQFILNSKNPISAETFSLTDGVKINIYEYAKAIIEQDKELSDFLFSLGLQVKDFLGAAEWVSRISEENKVKERWWSKDNLGRVPGLGKDWSYGRAFALEKYSYFIEERYNFSLIDETSAYHKKEIDSLEKILSRSKEANALIVSDEGDGALDIVIRLGRLIANGSVLPPIEHKRISVLDANAVINATKEKSRFENEMIKILNQAVKAGNIILVIQDLPSFVQNAKTLGSDIMNVIDPYLSSAFIQSIVFAETDRFHQAIETDSSIMKRFEKILVKNEGGEVMLRLLEEKAMEYERRQGVYFTYPAIVSIWESADRYFTDGVMPDKAIDLLVEIIPTVRQSGRSIIQKDDVISLVNSKTGIPMGEVKEEEKEKLLNLENFLHKRVVGQEVAIKAISNAMRRARSGVANPNRPMGSFLFLGPTGVGKTETSKALAEAFFGDENKIMRLDMSEYNSFDSLNKLIGSFEEGKVGVLTSMLREQSYGVLLLDEFEKTDQKVRDLFLQIVDEGKFADMSGKKVNARNLIIIATSNAGSDLIWELVKDGKNLEESKDTIIDDIINKQIFKPEMVNRFDGVVIFNPLKEDDLKSIAGFMLEKLKTRIREKGFDLSINDDLINYLVSQGIDPKFGARPLNRAIQEKVEELIAEKIIRGDIKPGSSISLTQDELV